MAHGGAAAFQAQPWPHRTVTPASPCRIAAMPPIRTNRTPASFSAVSMRTGSKPRSGAATFCRVRGAAALQREAGRSGSVRKPLSRGEP